MIGFFLLSLLLSVVLGICMAIVFVEKGNDWPVKPIRIRIQMILRKIHWKMPQMLYCTTCTSMWTTLIADIVVCILTYVLGGIYFFWPFSGFISAGIAWTLIELLNVLDKEKHINVFVNQGEENEIPIDDDDCADDGNPLM